MKLSKLDREVAKVDHEIAILQAVRSRLVAAQQAGPKRVKRPKPEPVKSKPSLQREGVDAVLLRQRVEAP